VWRETPIRTTVLVSNLSDSSQGGTITVPGFLGLVRQAIARRGEDDKGEK
jgi:hypothetical protein